MRSNLSWLSRYLELRSKFNRYNASRQYDEEVMGGNPINYATLCGHYSSLLDDVLEVVGEQRVRALVDAHKEIDKHMKSLKSIQNKEAQG